MAKYYLRYLIFLIPALLVSVFSGTAAALFGKNTAIILQWFFAFFMLVGFGASSASFAYHFPRSALSLMLYYTGLNLLIITLFYTCEYNTPLYLFLRDYGGALSYVPLKIIMVALEDFHNIYREVFVTLLTASSCLIGYIGGVVHRRVSPDPYRPRIG